MVLLRREAADMRHEELRQRDHMFDRIERYGLTADRLDDAVTFLRDIEELQVGDHLSRCMALGTAMVTIVDAGLTGHPGLGEFVKLLVTSGDPRS